MSFHALPPATTGLLFFDMLNAYFRGATPEVQQRMEVVVANAVKLRQAADAAGIPVFFAKADHRPDGADAARLYSDTDMALQPLADPERDRFEARHALSAGDWKGEVIDELGQTDEDYLIRKHRWSSFHQTKLELSLRARGIDTIILCGGAIEVGIVSTAYAARDLDFNQVIVRDACNAIRPEVGDVFMEQVFPRFARIRSTGETLAMIEAGVSEAR